MGFKVQKNYRIYIFLVSIKKKWITLQSAMDGNTFEQLVLESIVERGVGGK